MVILFNVNCLSHNILMKKKSIDTLVFVAKMIKSKIEYQ